MKQQYDSPRASPWASRHALRTFRQRFPGSESPIELTIDILLRASEVDGLDATNLLLGRVGDTGSRNGGGPEGAHGRHKGAALGGGRCQLAAQGASESLGDGSGGHFDGIGSGDGSRKRLLSREWGAGGFMVHRL